jgi:hypothetical protein
MWRAAIHGTLTLCSTFSFISHSFIFRAKHALISSVGIMLSGCVILYYLLDAQLFLQPHLLPHEQTHTDLIIKALASALGRTSQIKKVSQPLL